VRDWCYYHVLQSVWVFAIVPLTDWPKLANKYPVVRRRPSVVGRESRSPMTVHSDGRNSRKPASYRPMSHHGTPPNRLILPALSSLSLMPLPTRVLPLSASILFSRSHPK